jgi:hypothetical protein
MAQLRPKRNYGGGQRRADRQHAGAAQASSFDLGGAR